MMPRTNPTRRLAAKAAKITLVLVPKDNKKDIEEIEDEILEGISIQYVDHMEQVLEYALAKEEA